jgi:protein involved in polysaccharide export with SLBB domain
MPFLSLLSIGRPAAFPGLLVLAALLAGCSTPAQVALPDKDVLQLRHAEIYTLADLPPPEVLVQPGDSLRIVRDAQEPAEKDDMTLFVVRPDGLISIPKVGLVNVAGRTPQQVQEEITGRNARIYREPQVTVNIAVAPSNRVFIGGAVPNPAFFNLSGTVTVEQALLSAGGVLPTADSHNVALMRLGADQRYKLYFFDLAALLQNTDRPAVALQRGDLIFVPTSGIGRTVEAIDLYFTKLIPINKGVGVGFNYDLRGSNTINYIPGIK